MTAFSAIIKHYGDKAAIYKNSIEEEIKCFIQPVLSPSADKRVWSQMTELGERDTSRFFGFFPADAALDDAEYIICGGVYYDIVRFEMFRVMGRDSHWEAVLTKREEDYIG